MAWGGKGWRLVSQNVFDTWFLPREVFCPLGRCAVYLSGTYCLGELASCTDSRDFQMMLIILIEI